MKRKVWKLMDRPEGLNFEEALSLVEEDLESPSNNKTVSYTHLTLPTICSV